MMRQYELVERVASYDPNADEALLNRAYVYAMKAHGAQIRASGDPYFSHPLEVAAILTDLKLDDATIATALLHDTIEDTDATREEIDRVFGSEIGSLVEGLTKIGRLDLVSKRTEQAENLRKLLLAVSDDIRVLLVKLADRLHNMRTLKYVKPDKRRRIAQETMDIYAPLAGRMGMQGIREELEDLSFKVLNVEARRMIRKRLRDLSKDTGNAVQAIEVALRKALADAGINARVTGRKKRPYAIWSKMERKSIALEQLSDLLGFRIVAGSVDDCYRVLGVVHRAWRVVPGRFKDYISNPKQNDYRSIHTTVIGPGNQRVELQIRTAEMNDIAERGVAAHALYKDSSNGSGARLEDTSAYKWLRHLVDMLEEGDNPEEFLEHTRLELFYDQVFCFTPKGGLIALPKGATPIDFAYAVHTDIGNSCVGAKINGRHAPLMSELNNGDEVEIIRTPGQTPPAAWEQIAQTGKARAAIRRASRAAIREQYASLGKEIVRRALQRIGLEFSTALVKKALPRLALKTVDDLYALVGRGELASDMVRAAVVAAEEAGGEHRTGEGNGMAAPGLVGASKSGSARSQADRRNQMPAGNGHKLPIRGIKGDLPVTFAAESRAVPGDRIVGILTRGEGITIYPIYASGLRAFDDEPERWVDVTWDIDPEEPERFTASIEVTCLNEVGSLAEIAQVTGGNDGNIENLSMIRRSADFYDMDIDLGVWDLSHLNRIISGIRQLSIVHKVGRRSG